MLQFLPPAPVPVQRCDIRPAHLLRRAREGGIHEPGIVETGIAVVYIRAKLSTVASSVFAWWQVRGYRYIQVRRFLAHLQLWVMETDAVVKG